MAILDLDPSGIDRTMALGGVVVAIVCGFLIDRIRLLFFHPLSKFPGPRVAVITPYWIARRWNSGNYVKAIKEAHDQYGPIVRVAANELSFSSATSWRDIYGHVPGRKPFPKSRFLYEPLPGESSNVLSVSDPGVHTHMRRNLSHGFSAAALSGQESLVQRFIDQFIARLGENASEPKEMVTWLNLVTFDIIGELAFGESFGNLDAGKPHFWLEILFDSVEALTFLRSFEYFAPLRTLLRFLLSKNLVPARMMKELNQVKQYSHDQVKRRLQANPRHVDFLTKTVANRNADEVSMDEIQAQAEVMILAGSETTATALSGMLYYLGHNPAVYAKLAEEIRGSFDSYDAITGRASEGLSYLKAVIEEGLRIFPPVPIGLPRASPGETVDGHYIPQGTIVHTSSWAATHDETHFHRPFDFIPERWLDKDCPDEKAASQPFLLGTRACLGRHMAQLEMRLILCKLFWSHDLALVDDSLNWVAANKTYVFWKKPELWARITARHGPA